MSCENIDGQCGASWCDCDYQRRKLAAGILPTHRRIHIVTEQGNNATITGDPNMPEATRSALAAAIDALAKAAKDGTLS